jgi:hypothetical protein
MSNEFLDYVEDILDAMEKLTLLPEQIRMGARPDQHDLGFG